MFEFLEFFEIYENEYIIVNDDCDENHLDDDSDDLVADDFDDDEVLENGNIKAIKRLSQICHYLAWPDNLVK